MTIPKDYFNAVLFRKIGVSHFKEQRECEDNVAQSIDIRSGIKAIALSDGAGSCSNARLGSEITSKAAAEILSKKFDLLYSLTTTEAADFLLKSIQKELAEEGAKKGILTFTSLSATVIAAALAPDGRYILYHIGDGAAVGYSPEKGCTIISIYNHVGPANQTSFVTEREPLYNLVKGKGDFSSIILMSDGPENFLVSLRGINDHVRILQELSYKLCSDEISPIIENLYDLLTDSGMTDDCSFAILSDTRNIGEVYRFALTPTKQLLDEILRAPLIRQKVKRFSQLKLGSLTPRDKRPACSYRKSFKSKINCSEIKLPALCSEKSENYVDETVKPPHSDDGEPN